ncbi:hypothetical protein A2U01_0106592, partial [Trifolium medium]|nr:hypothetical protein [Trifolium medium]
QHQPPKEAGARSHQHVQQGISFKEVLSTEEGVAVSSKKVTPADAVVSRDVRWEVEVEEDKVALLRGAYVGFL